MLRLDNASSLIGATRTFRMLKSPSVDQTMAHDVFISYSSKDKLTADAVCAAMESRGIRCWIAPRDVLPGVPYAAALVNALRDSRIMVLVLSSDANQSQQVLRELERAASRGLAIIPLRIEDVVPSAEMEYYISSRHWLDALTPPLEHHLVRLCDTVKSLLAATPASPASDSHEQAVKHVPAEQKDVRMASADSPNLESAEGREGRCLNARAGEVRGTASALCGVFPFACVAAAQQDFRFVRVGCGDYRRRNLLLPPQTLARRGVRAGHDLATKRIGAGLKPGADSGGRFKARAGLPRT